MTDDTAKRAREEAERIIAPVKKFICGCHSTAAECPREKAVVDVVAAYIEGLRRQWAIDLDRAQAATIIANDTATRLEAELAEAQRGRDAARGEAANLYLRLNNVVECDLRMTRADLAEAEREIERLRYSLDGHHPEGHNATNAQMVEMRAENAALRRALAEAKQAIADFLAGEDEAIVHLKEMGVVKLHEQFPLVDALRRALAGKEE